MKKAVTLLFLLLSMLAVSAQGYGPDWASLDRRPVAPWFEDAKFGIFIHWGPYAVPAWTPVGTYSEWYQYWLENRTLFGNGDFSGSEVYDYHVQTYGPHFDYYEFGNAFRADLFDPGKWADLFRDAGARYVVITSKHHDGYCLWPSEEANDRGFPWNSMNTGPRRDLLGELTPAVQATGLKMGFYYSLYEWFHPWWQDDKKRFVAEHFHPQFKDLVERYRPDIVWGDGEWEMEADEWRTPELMAWLFNESSVKDRVVINDRWGKNTRGRHGGYYTTEYEAGEVDYDRPWEECRGMGFSFGYNRAEGASVYNDARTLVLMLADVVSKGGNLLLDIGPDGRGQIPPIMQDRLLRMGRWLDTYGEAIFGTRAWERPVQWSGGERDYEAFFKEQRYLSGEYILTQTLNPPAGYAAKEVFFTRKGKDLYAILPKWPGKELRLREVPAPKGASVTLLGAGRELAWRRQGKDLIIELPAYDPGWFSEEEAYAYVVKLSGLL